MGFCIDCLSLARSPNADMAESLLVLGRNPPARLRCCDCCAAGDGLRALLAHCRLFIRLEPRRRVDGGESGLLLPCLRSLWRLHRNEPGRFVFVEEHVQECRLLVEDGDEPLTDLPGCPGKWVASPPAGLTGVGEAERQLGVDSTGPLGRLVAAVAMRDRGA